MNTEFVDAKYKRRLIRLLEEDPEFRKELIGCLFQDCLDSPKKEYTSHG